MNMPTKQSTLNWLRAFTILLLIALVLPTSSASAMPPAQDPGPSARRLPDEPIILLDKQMSVADLSASAESVSSLAATPPGTNLVQDPSFEASLQNNETYWVQYSNHFGTPICDVNCNEPDPSKIPNMPHSGAAWAWFGGFNWDRIPPPPPTPEQGYVYQDINFPSVSCRSTLQFYLEIGAAPGSDANDYLNVRIEGTPVFSTNATQASLYPSYQLVSIDVSAFNGGLRRLFFESETSGQVVSFHVDDVSLVASNCTGTVKGDYDGDRKKDIAIYRPSNGTWYFRGVGNLVYGTPEDIPVPADYTGDGVTEIAVYRPSNGTWYLRGIGPTKYGISTDKPVPADYTGDGKAEIAVYRPSDGTWYLKGFGPTKYGTSEDIPVPADYNGDGKAEIAVYRPSNGNWYIKGMGATLYGTPEDIPAPADYNGDGKVEIAVFRPSNGTWYIKGIGPTKYGIAGDKPVPADYNGDGRAEIAVFRESDGYWYIRTIGQFLWGQLNDKPV